MVGGCRFILPIFLERDPETWGGGQSLRPSEADGEGAREVTLRERGRVNDRKTGLRGQQKRGQRGPGRARWDPCQSRRGQGEGTVTERTRERKNQKKFRDRDKEMRRRERTE